jgi:SpoVK/Ycf46/Vps4 family AAA+-type ATPase
MPSFTEELHTLIVAPFPYVSLVTYEESRVLGMLSQLAEAMKRQLAVWRPEEHADPGAALDALLDSIPQMPKGLLTVLIDAHPYLGDPGRARRMRAHQAAITGADATIFLVGPRPVVPPELAKDITVVDVPLPDRVELARILQRSLSRDELGSGDPERISLAALGLTAREALRTFRKAAHLSSLQRAKRRPFKWEEAVIAEKRRLMASAGALEFSEHGLGLSDVGGLEELKGWVDQRRAAFTQEAREFGLPQPKGLLLLGVQGCGKSLAAKALAGYWGLPLVRLDLGALFSGETPPQPALRAAAKAAEAMAPCVLWVDEIEKGFPEGDAETTRLLGTLLTWLQEKTAPVFFVATANAVDTLPPELLRRGRFDEIFFIDLPDLEARKQILGIHLASRGRNPAIFDTAEVAQLTPNYSGAELEQIVIDGLYTAFAADRDLEQSDLADAARALVPLFRLRETEIKALRTWARDRARPAGHDRSLVDLFKK